ncbi:hypothetical protein [Rubritalea sp.]|uniref:hypothetical protein n=1 Tax=Rubritalea sp. TaxID=2109375 RepID=UPI003EF474D7
MLILRSHLLLLGSIVCVTSSLQAAEKAELIAQHSASPAACPDALRQWHDICLGGDTDKIDNQIAKFEAELKLHPTHDLARAYLGSAYALKAKHSFSPFTKLSSLKKGKLLMEAAVKGSPNNLRVRMVRAIAYYKVPKRFDTRPTSIADFEILLAASHKPQSDLTPNEKQAILYYAFLAFSEENHPSANTAKSRCHKINPNSKYGKLTN